MCGGTDLIIQLRAGVRRPEYVVDVKNIPDLRRISFDLQHGLRLGAAVPASRSMKTPTCGDTIPGLTEAAHLIGSLQIQSRASVGGNLCNGSPAADTTPALIALGAKARVVGPKGERIVAVEDFCTGARRTVLQPGEILVELFIDAPGAAFVATPTCASSRATKWISRWSAWARADARPRRRSRASTRESAWARSVRRRFSPAEASKALIGKKLDDAAIDRAARAGNRSGDPDRRHARNGRISPPHGRRADPPGAGECGRTRAHAERSEPLISTRESLTRCEPSDKITWQRKL